MANKQKMAVTSLQVTHRLMVLMHLFLAHKRSPPRRSLAYKDRFERETRNGIEPIGGLGKGSGLFRPADER